MRCSRSASARSGSVFRLRPRLLVSWLCSSWRAPGFMRCCCMLHRLDTRLNTRSNRLFSSSFTSLKYCWLRFFICTHSVWRSCIFARCCWMSVSMYFFGSLNVANSIDACTPHVVEQPMPPPSFPRHHCGVDAACAHIDCARRAHIAKTRLRPTRAEP